MWLLDRTPQHDARYSRYREAIQACEEQELNREILCHFYHDNRSVKIYGHYPVIESK